MKVKVINLSDNLNLILETTKTRQGFKHIARLVENRKEPIKATINYINRTWETFEYELVIKKVLNLTNYLEKEKEALLNKIKTQL